MYNAKKKKSQKYSKISHEISGHTCIMQTVLWERTSDLGTGMNHFPT